ncbi:hypothetical protein K0M31_004305 [Melipona bicolor]|uniref:Uncharacterized protein n=1 Tax=Melipona bicolor TaxID=60889 RepID=A0AA40KN85_9HYME|nr:hypothetical protein K0M31_004305 [Melipona bicolor]
MNLLLLLLLTIFALGVATVPPIGTLEKVTGDGDLSQKVIAENQAQPNPQDGTEDKKVAKRSYGWHPWGHGGYGFGWYPGWPLYYGHGGYGGYGHGGFGYGYRGYGGWYKGW